MCVKYECIFTCLFAFPVRLLVPRPKRSGGIPALLFRPDEACVDPSENENGVVEVEVPFESPSTRSRALKLTILTFVFYKFYLLRSSIICSRSSLNFSSLSSEVELLEAVEFSPESVEFSLLELESEADAATPEFSVIQSSKCETAVKQCGSPASQTRPK